MSTELHKQIVCNIYAALEHGDNSVFAQHVAPDYVWRFPSQASWSKRFEGQQAVRERLLGPLFSLFQGRYTARLISLIAEGDRVAAEIAGHVLLKNGKLYDNQYCMLFRFKEGRIAEVVEYCDTDLEERVLGPYPQALAAFRAGVS